MIKMVKFKTFNSSTNILIHALQLHVCIAILNVHLNSLDNIYCIFENFFYTLSLPLPAVSAGMAHILSRIRISIRSSIFLYTKNIQNYSEYRVDKASRQLNRTSDAGNCGHGSSQPTSRSGNELNGDNILCSRLIASGICT